MTIVVSVYIKSTPLKFVLDIGQIYFDDNGILYNFAKSSQILEKLFYRCVSDRRNIEIRS